MQRLAKFFFCLRAKIAVPARLLPKRLLSVVEKAARSPSEEAGVL
jgi:hypothetical protein